MPALPDRDASLARRTFLASGAAVAGLGLTGCATGTAGEKPGSSPAAPASLTPDVAVATSALEQIRRVREAAEATTGRFPALSVDLGPVIAMHKAHESSLADAVPERARTSGTPAPYAVPPRRAAALRHLSAAETTLHGSLDGLALRAQSGEFARLLASMGAAVGQRVSGWPQ